MKVLMLNRLESSFIRQDFEILKSLGYEVSLMDGNNYWDYIKKWRDAKNHDIYFSWWANSAHTVFFSKLFRAKSILVAGGFDVASHDEIRYGYKYQPPLKRLITKICLNKANKVLAVSKFVKSEIEKISMDIDVDVVYLGIDTDKFKPVDAPRKPIILSVSCLNRENIIRKGLLKLVEAFKYIVKDHPGFKLYIVGRKVGGEREIQMKARKEGLNRSVKLTGFIPTHELINAYQKSKVYVQNSLIETFGFSVVEAMACGTPTVSSGCGALAEITGNAGLLANQSDPRDLADKISVLIENERLHRELSRKSRERVVKNFSLEKRCKAIERVVEEVMSN